MDPGDCICFRLRKAARAASRAYDEALAPVGLRNTQMALLGLLLARGDLPVSELAEQAVMERTTLTRNLAPLERDGLVTSGPGEDRRQRIVHLTARGRSKLQAALPLWKKAQARQSRLLGSSRKERLMRDLRVAAGENGG
jgi:DNA-binding MarR family transcriptional regulator